MLPLIQCLWVQAVGQWNSVAKVFAVQVGEKKELPPPITDKDHRMVVPASMPTERLGTFPIGIFSYASPLSHGFKARESRPSSPLFA